MLMVRLGVIPRRLLASCCSVEVMNGGEGLRCFLPRFTVCMVKGLPSTAAITASASASLFISALPSLPPKYLAVNSPPLSRSSSESSSQYSSGHEGPYLLLAVHHHARGHGLHPAGERPRLIFFHSSGESS